MPQSGEEQYGNPDSTSEVTREESRHSASPGGKACPSGPCQEGAILLGVMTPSGRLAYVQPPTKISAEFVARARAMGRPEARFRFSVPCREAGCPQWTGDGCAVVDMVIDATAVDPACSSLPTCAIRHSCRWYSQRGPAACSVCPLIVADVGGVATYRSTIASANLDEPTSTETNGHQSQDRKQL
jgi:hypothetical protein